MRFVLWAFSCGCVCAVVASCELIGGAGKLEFTDEPGAGGASPSSTTSGLGGASSATTSGGGSGGTGGSNNGEMCTSAESCNSKLCADGFCCDAMCAAACESCALTPKGKCLPLAAASAPKNTQCQGVCDGARACAIGLPVAPAKPFTGSGSDNVRAIAVDSKSNTLFAGYFDSSDLKIGSNTLVGSGSFDTYLAQLDSAGTPKWAKAFGGSQGQYPADVLIAANDEVVLVGHYQDTVSFGGQALPSAGNNNNIFAAWFDSGGGYLRHQSFGGSDKDYCEAGAIDKDGSVYLTGSSSSATITFVEPLSTNGSGDVFVVKMDKDGKPLWARMFGDNQAQTGMALAAGVGFVVVAGKFSGSMKIDQVTTLMGSGGELFVLKLDSSTGAAVWAQQFAVKNPENVRVAVGQNGEIAIATTLTNSEQVKIGSKTVKAMTPPDLLAFVLDSDGMTRWATTMGMTAEQYGRAVAIDALGNVIVAGDTTGDVGWPSNEPCTPSARDTFIAKLAGDGTFLYGHCASDANNQYARALAIDPKTRDAVLGADTESNILIGRYSP
jgi:hypothetical protein